jgi:lysophospholipid acyltransferase
MIFCGLAYDGHGKSGNIKYDRYTNCKESEVELGYYVKKMVYSWNITIQYWMKKYVYMRLVAKGEDAPIWKFLFVFLISAFWHGFYPSYYFFFSYVGIYLFLSGDMKYFYSYYFQWMPQTAQILCAYFFTTWINLYIGSSFMMFNPSDLIHHYNCQYWYGHILLISVFVLTLLPVGVGLKKKAKKALKEKKLKLSGDKAKKD